MVPINISHCSHYTASFVEIESHMMSVITWLSSLVLARPPLLPSALMARKDVLVSMRGSDSVEDEKPCLENRFIFISF